MLYKLITFAFLVRVWTALAYKYEVQFRDEKFFLPCEKYPNNSLDIVIKRPENVTVLSDSATYVYGDVVIIYDFDPLQKYETNMEFFKFSRGSWQKTLYSIRRDDFCTSFFNPSELWSPFLKEMPAEQRKCPFRKGQIFSINATTDQSFEMPTGSLEGDYWAHFEAGDRKNLDMFFCIDSYFNIYRV
ncbi:hypothetical protein FF38_00529 [Lucilia cuprina]|uniref:MD-2-related lipid-recognition domain-containing protein n=1 Tax=Lucilia cuprina TaxID=7375 RepID=A0A0L0CQA3_LUCCU|nr:hypothetical protein FF38_00529 [Lucilia cuprina]